VEVIVERGCGTDVHKKSVVACLLLGTPGSKPKKLLRTFDTTTPGLLEYRDWLLEYQVTHVAMESTGVYWKPVHAILEGTFKVIIGNAKHMRNVPGRKTDVKDAEWIADLLRHGLIKASFVPPKDVRQLRDLVRYRTKLTQARTAERNRLLKLLEDANIKLSSVATDVFGKSGMEMLEALIAGTETPAQMAEHARGRLRGKIPELSRALHGHVEAHHRQILRLQMRRMSELDRDIAEIDAEVDRRLEPHREDRERLDGIPGVDWILTAVIIAELGLNMAVFPSAHHASAWAGIAPGSFQSAGKALHHQARKGNVHLRTALVQAANAAAHTKNTWLGEKFRRLRARRGHKRAAMAIGRKILTAAFAILSSKCSYRELGANYIDHTAKSNVASRLARRLTKLGYLVVPPTSASSAPETTQIAW
jgi:transposase